MLSAGLSVALLAVAVPVGLSLLGGADHPDSGQNRVAAPPTALSPATDIYGGPPRGSLAGDVAFVEAVRQLPWTTGAPTPNDPNAETPNPEELLEPSVGSRRVILAGDVAAGRWALVVGDLRTPPMTSAPVPTSEQTRTPDLPPPGAPVEASSPQTSPVEDSPPPPSAVDTSFPEQATGLVAAWFTGPPGASAAQMELAANVGPISPDQPATLYDVLSGSLVVVAAPGDLIEVSARPDVAADATVSRTYLDAGTSDGVAVVDLGPGYFAPPGAIPVNYRVSRAGLVVAEQQPFSPAGPLPGSPFTVGPPEPEFSYVRSPVEGYYGEANGLAQEMLGEYGLLPDEVDLEVHYVGPVPGVNGTPDELTAVSLTFPSGAVLIRAETIPQAVGDEPDEPVGGASAGRGVCTNSLSAAGTPAAQRVAALRCDVVSGKFETDPALTTSTLVILAPPDLASGYAVAEGSSGPITVELTDGGMGMASFPEGAQTAVIHAADGTVVAEVPILTAQ